MLLPAVKQVVTLAKIGGILYILSDGPRYIQDNTEGRLSLMDKLTAAYIAGFFDGDGSVRLQFQPRKGLKLGFRVRAIISIAQKTRQAKELGWIRNQLGIGYIYHRNDDISELKIEGFEQVKRILNLLKPYVRFKRKQVNLMLEALNNIDNTSEGIILIAEIADKISNINYATTKKRYTAEFVRKSIEANTPVTTESNSE